MALNPQHQTPAQFLDRIVAEFKRSNRERKARIVKLLLKLIADGDLTDTQLRNKLGLTVAQYDIKKTQMQNLVAANSTLQSAVSD